MTDKLFTGTLNRNQNKKKYLYRYAMFLSLAGMKDEFKDIRANLDTALGDYRDVIGQQNQQIAGTINVIYGTLTDIRLVMSR